MPFPALLLDEQGSILQASPSLDNYSALPAHMLHGRPISEAYLELGELGLAWWHLWQQREYVVPAVAPILQVQRQGISQWWQPHLQPLAGDSSHQILVYATETAATPPSLPGPADAPWQQLAHSSCCLSFLGPRLVTTYVSPYALRWTGKTLRSGVALADALPETAAPKLLDQVRRVYRSGLPAKIHGQQLLLNGQTYHCDIICQPLCNGRREVTGIVALVSDASGRRRRQLQQQERYVQLQQQQLHTAAALPCITYRCNDLGEVLYFSPQWYALTGQLPRQIQNAGWLDALHPEDASALLQQLPDIIAQSGSWSSRLRIRTVRGAYRWHLSQAQAVLDAAGNPAGWYGTLTDIEQQQETAELLTAREQARLQLANLLPFPSWTLTAEGKVQHASAALLAHLKASAGLAPDQHWLGLLTAESKATVTDRFQRGMQACRPFWLNATFGTSDGPGPLHSHWLVPVVPSSAQAAVQWQGISVPVNATPQLRQCQPPAWPQVAAQAVDMQVLLPPLLQTWEQQLASSGGSLQLQLPESPLPVIRYAPDRLLHLLHCLLEYLVQDSLPLRYPTLTVQLAVSPAGGIMLTLGNRLEAADPLPQLMTARLRLSVSEVVPTDQLFNLQQACETIERWGGQLYVQQRPGHGLAIRLFL